MAFNCTIAALRFAGHRYVAAPEIKVDIVTKQAHTQVARGAEAAWHTGDIQVLRQNESNPPHQNIPAGRAVMHGNRHGCLLYTSHGVFPHMFPTFGVQPHQLHHR